MIVSDFTESLAELIGDSNQYQIHVKSKILVVSESRGL